MSHELRKEQGKYVSDGLHNVYEAEYKWAVKFVDLEIKKKGTGYRRKPREF